MKIRNLMLVFLIFFISASCEKGENELERDYIKSVINNLTLNETVKWMVILPGMGCHGCIQEGEVFMKDYISKSDIYFVLTKIESLKILQQKIDVELKEHSNVYIDNKVGFKIPTKNSVYPCVVYLNNGKIESHEFQSPGNNAFEKLRSKINFVE